MHYGYIGLGNLGGHLAHSLVKKGYKVTVFDIDKSLAERHLKDGAEWANSRSGHLHQPSLRQKSMRFSPACHPLLSRRRCWLKSSPR
jgi:6-phosphogluconate dehydrogenase (decarboxylating)